jgi:hypothetical protein
MSSRRFRPPWSIAIESLRAHFIGNAGPRYGRAYWCTQSAKAGPGLFEHDAVSVSPFLVIETAPRGHVTEATVSPASQVNLQFSVP